MASKAPAKLKDATKYTSKEWRALGGIAEPTTREKMIMLAIEQIKRVGPVDFNALEICERLDIKAPMVNYHFGSRDGFIAETTWFAYQMWTTQVDECIRSAPKDPVKRLRAFIKGEVTWAKRMGGMHILINYPLTSSNSQAILVEKHAQQMQKAFDYHLALLSVIIRDIDRGTVSDLEFDADSLPRKEFLLTPGYLLKATQISWATHGLASWSSGKHVPTLHMESNAFAQITSEIAANAMVEAIISIATMSEK
ncbi:MAG: hypothetical protein RL196_702 [Actinomycetota bacterium]|jgi:AcrR family transcriptional regulator